MHNHLDLRCVDVRVRVSVPSTCHGTVWSVGCVDRAKQQEEEEEALEALCLGFWSAREQMEVWTVQ